MLIHAARQLTLEEVQARIRDYEKEDNASFDEFEQLFWKRKLDRRLMSAYSEWADLVHAYRGYVERGELDHVIGEELELDPKETELLTSKRLELLYSLASLRPVSINDLAQKTRRDVKKVYQDLMALRALGFVSLHNEYRSFGLNDPTGVTEYQAAVPIKKGSI